VSVTRSCPPHPPVLSVEPPSYHQGTTKKHTILPSWSHHIPFLLFFLLWCSFFVMMFSCSLFPFDVARVCCPGPACVLSVCMLSTSFVWRFFFLVSCPFWKTSLWLLGRHFVNPFLPETVFFFLCGVPFPFFLRCWGFVVFLVSRQGRWHGASA